MVANKFAATFSYKLIYIFRINDEEHKGKLKIGEATVHTNKSMEELPNNCDELNRAAKDRINAYTTNAGIKYELLHTELSIKNDGTPFNDKKVHTVLLRSGLERFYFDTERKQNEWFIADLETAKKAIIAVKEGKKALNSNQISFDKDPIIFRPEQEKAIKATIENFKKSDTMLWNAKMRFGKTLTALEVVKRQKYKRTLIITHRPVVNKGWFEDFEKIFDENSEYQYGSKTYGEDIDNLIKSNKPFVYFASMQDLRGSTEVGGHFKKDEIIFNCNWDLVVIDEAHEGTRTSLGEKTIEGVVKINDNYKTKVLMLSGTPFNLLSDFKEDEIYTWDYIMEQAAKLEWDKENFGDHNPYSDLPQLNIYTYYLNKLIPGYVDVSDSAFNFREFFRTWTGEPEIDRRNMPENVNIGDFVHKEDVSKFLNLLVKQDEYSNYPYSTDEYREYFRHSLWMVPGVKEARALSKLLKEHSVFGSGAFQIVNVAGNGDEEEKYEEALKKVQNAITDKPEETYTITISCGRLTTGVSVPEWTAVFMLSGTYSTAASSYLQTIFRVQTPGTIGGKVKEKCYVFDFAPDRTLKMVAQAGQLSVKPGSIQSKVVMSDFLNFCPVIGINGSQMTKYDVTKMLSELKKAVAQRVVTNGFDDKNIYNDNLLKLDDIELEEFDNLKKIIGTSKQAKKIENIDINNQGFTDEEYEELEKIKKKAKKELTEEEKRQLEELKEKRKQASTAISILRGISIRIPLLIYGADIDINRDIDCDNFIELVDDKSWEEFMPNGVTKEIFKKFSKYYDNEIFIEAGRQIRSTALYADTLPIKQRIQKLAEIFSMFRNPDKETVLTPWKTVNMHLSDCIGGYNFNYPDNEPRFVNQGDVTTDLFNNKDVKILEINSKTGLYALYVAYSIYMNKFLNYNKENYNEKMNEEFWKDVLDRNIFIICKTKMAVQIVKRTLAGYKDYKVNTLLMENIVEELKENNFNCVNIIKKAATWNKEGDIMNFNAIVGNPPYQRNTTEQGSQATPLYDKFVIAAKKIQPEYLSMIMPSRWLASTNINCLNDFRSNMVGDSNLKKIIDFTSARDCFENVNISGGICYFLWDKKYKGECDFTNVREGKISRMNRKLNEFPIIFHFNEAVSIVNKIEKKDYIPLNKIVSAVNPFNIPTTIKGTIKKIRDDDLILHTSKGKFFIEKDRISKGIELIDKYKVLLSQTIPGKAGETGKDGKHPVFASTLKVINKNEVCTHSYIVIGNYNNENEANNLLKYLKTKMVRFLTYLSVTSIHLTQNNFKFVPLQDFTDNSDIKWSTSIEEIDKQLYRKYDLTNEEIDFINSTIKPIN